MSRRPGFIAGYRNLFAVPWARFIVLAVLIEGGIFFAGTPDKIYQQIKKFSDGVGGVDHMLLLSQAGLLSHAETVDSLTLFAKEVMPRLKELKSNHEVAQIAAE